MANKWSLAPRPTIEPSSVQGARWVPLTQNRWALVDECDFEQVSRHSWCYIKGRHTGYAQTNIHLQEGGYRRETMHRMITNFEGQVDHKDGDGLNNRRFNFRLVSDTQNRMNGQKHVDNKSGFKGVTFQERRWRATIVVNKKQLSLGRFDSPEDAARAYDAAARQYFGEFARTNFKED